MPTKLTDQQKERLGRLEPALRRAVRRGDYQAAVAITADIQALLRPSGHETRLMQAKNWLFEAALMAGELDVAVQGLLGVRAKTNKGTRVNLEATALLALAYIRKQALKSAEPLIAEVLKNDKFIRNPRRRYEFHRRIIQRFDEEGALALLEGRGHDAVTPEEVHDQAVILIQTKTEDEIFEHLGEHMPPEVADFILKVELLSRNQLSAREVQYFPPPRELVKKSAVGRTVFGSAKRVLWRSLCDPESDIYKAWFDKGMAFVLSGKFIAAAVVAASAGQGLGYKALLVSTAALAMKFGIEVFCDHFQPDGIMDVRTKREGV